MADILQAAKAYKKLLDVEYQIVLGKKEKNLSLAINFEEYHFFHLAGLQYLKDLSRVLTESREQIFRRILKGTLQKQLFESSEFYPEIKDRIEYLIYLESLMDSNETIFKYNPALETFSAIQADFLLKNQVQARNIFIFLSGDKSNGKYFCRSFFPQTDKDYSLGQTNWTLLYKKKIHKSAQTETVLYDRMKR
ncbi:MAG: hypothetical protein IJ530_05590 [Treponema sp.]|uniref:PBECR4 domain-containing protein n=1 Tax=Treponema sp. TaxID=166 RepID=UPI0025D17E55|nr:PBECR4 domain-containing protein [Treponema sp.]MBQ8679221.1 hypothetical protein [Treponema sp.]